MKFGSGQFSQTSVFAVEHRDHALHSTDSLPPEMQQRLADILDRYLAAVEQGQRVDMDRLVGQYPEYESVLREYLEGLQLLQAIPAPTSDHEASPYAELPPRQLGDYKVIREIGRGGMGVVYEAEQISLGRRVALKVLPFAAMLDSRQILRFENEARAAAQLQHPNIVPVHGIGSDEGVHFYAMQHIDGLSLREWIEDVREQGRQTGRLAALETTVPDHSSDLQRAKWLANVGREVAAALEAAHQCGVIHRDVKPGNILLDHDGKVWITDFGLARCQTNQSMTNSGDIVGTLLYMSPEQAKGQNAYVDPRADVYSLGVTLYELLTLQRPFQGDGHAQVLRDIEQGRYEPLRQRNPNVPRDLACIVEKAMSACRNERYESAQAMSEDLERFLQNEPILAKPPSPVQKILKWADRHRAVVLAACIVLLTTTICLGVATLIVARDQQRTLEKLEENRKTFEEFGLRTSEWLKGVTGTERVRRALLSEVLRSHRQLLEQVGDTPELRRDAALALEKIAAIHSELGESQAALEKYREAEGILEAIARESKDYQDLLALARCKNQIGLVLHSSGKNRRAEKILQDAISIQAKLRQREQEDNWQAGFDLSNSWSNRALVLSASDGEQALDCYRRAYTMQQELYRQDPQSFETLEALAMTSGNLATLYARLDLDAGIQWSEKSLQLRHQLVADQPENASAQQALAAEHSDLATLRARQGNVSAAISNFQAAVSIQQRLATAHGGVVSYRRDLAVTLNNLGKALSDQRRIDESEKAFLDALAIQESLCQEFPADTSLLCQLGCIHNNLGMGLQENGRTDSAERQFQAALSCLQQTHRVAPQVSSYRDYLSRSLFNYATFLRDQGKYFQAANVTRKRSTLWENEAGQLVATAKELTLCIRRMPEGRRRENWQREAVELLRQAKVAGWRPSAKELQTLESVLDGGTTDSSNREA